MAKGRYSRLPSRKSSSSTLILTMLIMFTFVILILLAFGILSIPSTSSDSSRKANDLSNIIHNKIRSIGEDDGRGERWAEVISWEPRAFVYHNFLNRKTDVPTIKKKKKKKTDVPPLPSSENPS